MFISFGKSILLFFVFSIVCVFSVNAQRKTDLRKTERRCYRPKIISIGVINGKAINLIKPLYPPAARMARITGAVAVQVQIGESGNVKQAKAASGHILLKPAAIKAARYSKFEPMFLGGCPVTVTGIIIYDFMQ